MHLIDAYQKAVVKANQATVEKFNVNGPYEPNSECHKFWIKEFDYFFGQMIKAQS